LGVYEFRDGAGSLMEGSSCDLKGKGDIGNSIADFGNGHPAASLGRWMNV
jgi:hypothetical protein